MFGFDFIATHDGDIIGGSGGIGSGGGSLPPYIAGGTSTTGTSGGYIQSGQSWLNDLLNFGLGIAALGNQGTIQGGAINPRQQIQYLSNPATIQQPSGGGSVGASFGSSLENFIRNNSGILLIAGIGLVLWRSGRK